jgi:hypothetical protein
MHGFINVKYILTFSVECRFEKSKEKMDVSWLHLTETVDVYDNRIIQNKEERLCFVCHDIYFVFFTSEIRFIEVMLAVERTTPLTQSDQ